MRCFGSAMRPRHVATRREAVNHPGFQLCAMLALDATGAGRRSHFSRNQIAKLALFT
jgi:hypothetical protein